MVTRRISITGYGEHWGDWQWGPYNITAETLTKAVSDAMLAVLMARNGNGITESFTINVEEVKA